MNINLKKIDVSRFGETNNPNHKIAPSLDNMVFRCATESDGQSSFINMDTVMELGSQQVLILMDQNNQTLAMAQQPGLYIIDSDEPVLGMFKACYFNNGYSAVDLTNPIELPDYRVKFNVFGNVRVSGPSLALKIADKELFCSLPDYLEHIKPAATQKITDFVVSALQSGVEVLALDSDDFAAKLLEKLQDELKRDCFIQLSNIRLMVDMDAPPAPKETTSHGLPSAFSYNAFRSSNQPATASESAKQPENTVGSPQATAPNVVPPQPIAPNFIPPSTTYGTMVVSHSDVAVKQGKPIPVTITLEDKNKESSANLDDTFKSLETDFMKKAIKEAEQKKSIAAAAAAERNKALAQKAAEEQQVVAPNVCCVSIVKETSAPSLSEIVARKDISSLPVTADIPAPLIPTEPTIEPMPEVLPLDVSSVPKVSESTAAVLTAPTPSCEVAKPNGSNTQSGCWKCKCGEEENDSAFCMICGSKRPVIVKACPNCGLVAKDKYKRAVFCPHCGVPLKDTEI